MWVLERMLRGRGHHILQWRVVGREERRGKKTGRCSVRTDRTVKEEPHSRKTIHSQLPPSVTLPPTLAASPPFSHRRITKTWNSASKILPTKSHPSMNYFLKIRSVLALYWCYGDITGESAFPVWALLLDSCQEKHLGLQWLLFNLWLSGYFFTW